MESKKALYIISKSKSIKSIIGTENIKSINDNLSKGDIIIYNEQLYKCKNGGKYTLPDEQNFRKVGLRFLSNEYKEKAEDSIDGLYKKIYEQFQIGDKQKIEWTNNNKLNEYYFFTPKDITEIELYNSTNSSISLETFIDILKKYSKVDDIEYMLEFPLILDDNIITKENYEEYKFNTFYIEDLVKIKLKKEVFNEAINSEFRKIQEYIKNPKSEIDVSSFIYFTYEKKQVHKYYANYVFGIFENDKNFCLKLNENDDFTYGLYKNNEPLNFDFNFDNIDVALEYDTYSTYERTGENDYEEINHYKLSLSFSENKIKPNKEIYFFVKDFWLPFYNDMLANDNSGKSARKLNADFNKYGIYFKLNKDDEGIYEFKFKIVFTDKNQHEEYGSCGQWGKRYAYYLNEKNVRTSNCSYCTWQDKKVDITFSFKLENGEIKEQKLIFTEKTNDTEKFEKEFMETGITFEDGVLYLKVFYAIWSLDDAGEWNEWQFAHIIPPFELEFKGE
ncbi:hypothetical protein [Streptobacillus moniliformis]|uniref:hypothetical protein n=1 Tax=Streptobacillus moniliformis TaxID=34105 RepID=UPI0007E3B065|nr:hypothetical protein [Streptobacillus moniliformis]